MKKNYLLFAIFAGLLSSTVVHAETCPLEKQVEVNNAAGAVSASASPLDYEYVYENEETGEEAIETAYIGDIGVYNLTEDIYVVVSDGKNKTTLTYNDSNDGEAHVSTGDMYSVKNYKVSVYPVNERCGKSAIKELNVTVPRQNRFYTNQGCQENPDYFYCSQFITLDDISDADFTSGLNSYISQNTKKDEDNRKQGIIAETASFIKKHWLVIIVIILIIGGGAGSYIYIKNKKRKESIV
ncbi:MAG: hypothetical protein PUD34_05065 [bacterium]|nr:hypothetical protein [bacterium]